VETSFRQIAIVGLGLIGGSWAAALKKRGYRGEVVGCDRPETIRVAQAGGLIHHGAEDAAWAVRKADLVIVATPVGAILDLLPPLRAAVPPHALVTDVGSTKRLICQRARELFEDHPMFLGGHPMAGREGSGLAQADADLFERAPYALTPLTPDHLTDPRAQAFSALLEALGARPFVTEPSAHDRAVAFLSHLPQLLSTALSSLVEEQGMHEFVPLELAASGFRDMTRLAGSPYALWRDICLTNIENIQSALESLIEKLEGMKLHLSDRELEREFHRALKLREELARLT
jgi:prephenate dehydrogenase